MTVTHTGFTIRGEKDQYTQRVIAVDEWDMEIVGAYRPHALNDWRVYVSKFVTDAVGVDQPHKVHACSREDAVTWVVAIATLYTMAVTR